MQLTRTARRIRAIYDIKKMAASPLLASRLSRGCFLCVVDPILQKLQQTCCVPFVFVKCRHSLLGAVQRRKTRVACKAVAKV